MTPKLSLARRRLAAPAAALALATALLLAGPSPARAAWTTYGGNAQHTAVASVPTQPLQQIHWQAPVDLQPQYVGSDLFIHYGSPLITEGNTVMFPVKLGVADTFRVEAHAGLDGSLRWQLDTDYQLPPHNWTPSVGLALTPRGRLYVAGAGGTLLWTDALDAPVAHAGTRVAFYGLASYTANTAAMNASLRVCTPLTSDANGTVYFGVRAATANPLGIGNAIAAVDASGNGRFVSVGTATGGAATQVAMNCAPALSADEGTLYIGVRANSSTPGYLLALATADLTTRGFALLRDPVTLSTAIVSADGTASPMVAPDGKVYYGALENPFGSNGARGWLVQFDAALNPGGAPGSFGWDDTPSLVPASAVPGYAGSSPYLLMVKYNAYAGVGTGDGVNQIAILDPGDTQPDVRTPATIMKEVLTIAGVTPDMEQRPTYPNAVREWCINTAVVDPFTHSVLAGSEDGVLYRWDLATNAFSESITLTPGIGEAYTPTVSGPDGQVYAINNATLFAVGATSVGVPAGAGTGGREVALAPARPNPFVAATTLRFTLAHEHHVSLEVLDLSGQRVVTLYDGTAGAGEHVVGWGGRDAQGGRRAAGIYFARLSAGGASVTRKLLLIR
jgi:hypothetical protein